VTSERVGRLRRNHRDEVVSDQLEQLGAERPAARPGSRARILAWLASRFGASLLLPTLR
jgi:hypothetical protein